MNNIKIETVTSVHIGSGNLLYPNMDYVVNKDVIGIIDEKKILDLIGANNLNHWVNSIGKGESLKGFMQRFAPNATMGQYTHRQMTVYLEDVTLSANETLKEQLHDGRGLPYIPGSSIKGAIRTAVLANLAQKNPGQINLGTGRFMAKPVERHFFGNDANSDVFRFLQVGDAYFKNEDEIVIRMENLNIRERQDFWDDSKAQLIEALIEETDSSLKLKLDTKGYLLAQKKAGVKQIQTLESLDKLFQTINNHTLSLLQGELSFWKKYDDEDVVQSYLEQIEGLLEDVESCQETMGRSCILRIGHASGWRFITGGWAEKLPGFTQSIVPTARPKNHQYASYPFPKSRRLDHDGYLLGFVKLTQTNNE